MRRLTHLVLVPLLAAIIATSLASSPSQACNRSLPEDLNGDGKVDMNDVLIVVEAFGSYPGCQHWNLQADIDTDGRIDMRDIGRIVLKLGVCVPKFSTVITIYPRTLNLKSHGRWITVYIKFLEDCNIGNIDISTLRLNGTVPVESRPMSVWNNTLMVKFDRAALESYISNSISLNGRFTKVALTVSGKLEDGTAFTGTDSITAIMQR